MNWLSALSAILCSVERTYPGLGVQTLILPGLIFMEERLQSTRLTSSGIPKTSFSSWNRVLFHGGESSGSFGHVPSLIAVLGVTRSLLSQTSINALPIRHNLGSTTDKIMGSILAVTCQQWGLLLSRGHQLAKLSRILFLTWLMKKGISLQNMRQSWLNHPWQLQEMYRLVGKWTRCHLITYWLPTFNRILSHLI